LFDDRLLLMPNVVTKPDCGLEESVKAMWVGTLQGQKDPLELGYYCVKLLSEQQRAADADTQREAMKYLEQFPPWNQQDKSRCGIPSLVQGLDKSLVEMTIKS
jgi:hypothetical protein